MRSRKLWALLSLGLILIIAIVALYFSQIKKNSNDTNCITVNYTAQAGDTVAYITAEYGIPVDSLKKYNWQLADPIKEGVVIVIPLCEMSKMPNYHSDPTVTPTE